MDILKFFIRKILFTIRYSSGDLPPNSPPFPCLVKRIVYTSISRFRYFLCVLCAFLSPFRDMR